VQPRDELVQLLGRTRAAQRDAAHVIVEVDVVIVDPHRLAELERHRRELARQHRRQVQPLREHRLEVFVEVAFVALGQLEHHQAADMHRHLGRLEMQERGVHAGQVVHVVFRCRCVEG
jgi:hypothetical protein